MINFTAFNDIDIPFTLVLVRDEKTQRFSSYFEELPNIHASGNNEEEVASNLIETVKAVFKHKQKESEVLLSETKFIAKRELFKLQPA